MAKATTVRIPEDLLKEVDKFARELHMDRSTYLREIIRKGLYLDKQERYLAKYNRRELSMGEACKVLGLDAWQFLERLKERGMHLSVALEDWLDSSSLEE